MGMPVVIALGMFDGVHAGHRRLLKSAVSLAEKHNAKSVMLTFQNHPSEIICPDKMPMLLTTAREKATLAAECGINKMALLWFDDDFAALSPVDFIEKYILQTNIKGVVCGFNYRFGRQASGDSEFLKQYLGKRGIDVIIEPPILIDGVTASSTYIRELIENGEMERARQFLSAQYIIGGVVMHGFERGRTLGFPTANIIPAKGKLLPPAGVYATLTGVDSRRFFSITNVGTNPTFKNAEKTVETYIQGLNEDIYGKYITVIFCKLIRHEISFASPEELKKQMALDLKKVNAYFNSK